MELAIGIPALVKSRLQRWLGHEIAMVSQPLSGPGTPFAIRRTNPAGLWSSPRLTQMVEVQGARLVFLSGQTPTNEKYEVPSMDIRAQVNRVYDNIEIALQAAGATWDNVVKTTTYLADAAFIEDFRDVRTERFKSFKAPPANTLIVVNRLAEPEFLVEIEAIAAVPVA